MYMSKVTVPLPYILTHDTRIIRKKSVKIYVRGTVT